MDMNDPQRQVTKDSETAICSTCKRPFGRGDGYAHCLAAQMDGTRMSPGTVCDACIYAAIRGTATGDKRWSE